jgi:hypothetical protein
MLFCFFTSRAFDQSGFERVTEVRGIVLMASKRYVGFFVFFPAAAICEARWNHVLKKW